MWQREYSIETYASPETSGNIQRCSRMESLFEDETILGDIQVLVAHRIEPLGSGVTRITYAAKVTGLEAVAELEAEDVGPAGTADFPDVLQSLVRLAERSEA